MDKVGKYTFRIEPGEADLFGKYPLPAIIRRMLDCAGYHADERGWGLRDLGTENHAWVLARLVVEMEDFPNVYDQLEVQTWVEDLNKHFSSRNFCFRNQNGNILGYARTIWSMIDLKTRKSVDLTAVSDISNHKVEKECPIDKPGKISSVNFEADLTYKIKYSDLDVNRHVNSSKYAEHILNLFSPETLMSKQLKRFEIAYLSESTYDDCLSFHQAAESDLESVVEIRNAEIKPVCRAKIIFRNKNI